MKILLAQNLGYFTRGGASKVNRLLVEGLAGRGHICRVIAPAGVVDGQFRRGSPVRQAAPVRALDLFHHNGVEVHTVSDSYHLSAYLAAQIHEFEPAVTLVSEDRSFLPLAVALEESRGGVVYMSLSQAVLPFGPECFLPDPSKTDLLRRASGIVVVSEYLKRYIKRWSGLDSVALDFPAYGPGPFPCFGRFDDGFLMMINPSAIKGISIFLKLAESLPEVKFAAVPTWATTEADRSALLASPNIRVLAAVENMDELYSQTRVLLVPSLWGEAFGLVVVEAMLRGIPVLASDIGGLPEAKLGVEGLIPVRPIERYEKELDERLLPVATVPEQDIGPWLEAISPLLSDRAHYQRVSAASRTAALDFVSGLSVAPFEKFLEGLLSALPDGDSSSSAESREANADLPDNLSPERLALLARLLREKQKK